MFGRVEYKMHLEVGKPRVLLLNKKLEQKLSRAVLFTLHLHKRDVDSRAPGDICFPLSRAGQTRPLTIVNTAATRYHQDVQSLALSLIRPAPVPVFISGR